jgi:hypothetical protein
MVDFNNEQTIATAPKQVVNMIIIEHYYNLLEAREKYDELVLQGSPGNLARLRSRLITIITAQYSAFKRTYEKDEETWTKIKSLLNNKHEKTEEEIYEILILAIEWLDAKRLIRVDDRAERDFTNIQEDNEFNGFT